MLHSFWQAEGWPGRLEHRYRRPFLWHKGESSCISRCYEHQSPVSCRRTGLEPLSAAAPSSPAPGLSAAGHLRHTVAVLQKRCLGLKPPELFDEVEKRHRLAASSPREICDSARQISKPNSFCIAVGSRSTSKWQQAS